MEKIEEFIDEFVDAHPVWSWILVRLAVVTLWVAAAVMVGVAVVIIAAAIFEVAVCRILLPVAMTMS